MSARIALAAVLLSGCCFGRSYGPAEYNTVFVAPPSLVPRADSSLPEDVCKDLCKDFIASDETLLGCFIASLQSAPIPPKRSLRWEYRHDGAWLNNSMVLTDDDMKGLDPDHVDPALSFAASRPPCRSKVAVAARSARAWSAATNRTSPRSPNRRRGRAPSSGARVTSTAGAYSAPRSYSASSE